MIPPSPLIEADLKSSATAKFILAGEHSIVTRGRALAFPLPQLKLGLEVQLENKNPSPRELIVNGQLRSAQDRALIEKVFATLGAPANLGSIIIKSQIPIGSGLGSSAALCVAAARAFNPTLRGEALAQFALRGERMFHLHPSGIDPYTIAIEEPLLFYHGGKSWRALQVQKFLATGARFQLFNTGIEHRTSDVQKAVESTRRHTPLIYENLMDSLSSNTEEMLRAFEGGHIRQMGQIMNDSHFRLLQLGVSNDTIETLVEKVLAQAGCLGAKITGAGCGGFVLGLFEAGANSSDGASAVGSSPVAWPA